MPSELPGAVGEQAGVGVGTPVHCKKTSLGSGSDPSQPSDPRLGHDPRLGNESEARIPENPSLGLLMHDPRLGFSGIRASDCSCMIRGSDLIQIRGSDLGLKLTM